MDAFVNSFLAVDKDGSGQITEDELRQYVAENKMDTMMVAVGGLNSSLSFIHVA